MSAATQQVLRNHIVFTRLCELTIQDPINVSVPERDHKLHERVIERTMFLNLEHCIAHGNLG